MQTDVENVKVPSSMTAQVVVAGAGPVGLMLASELRLRGVDVLVVEQRATSTVGESRAPGLNARTMELLEQRGLADRFRRTGKPLSFVVFAGIPLDPHEQDPQWPDGWILPQHETERILAQRADELGVRIQWSTAVTGVRQGPDGVEVELEGSDGHQVARAGWVVGCDGAHSQVRKASGIDFPGLAAETWWVVGDVDLADPPPASEPFGDNETVGRYQLSSTEPGWYRLNIMLSSPPADPASPVALEEVRAAMIAGIGWDHGLRGARWMSRWSDGFRHASSYRAGRVLLAGDAAHTHTPVGGQGLNLGIQDAVNLGYKLAAVVNEEAPEALLDTYHAERWPVAEAVLTQSMGQTELVKPGPRRRAITRIFQDLLDVPEAAQQLCGELTGLTLRYPVRSDIDHPLLGGRMPNLTLSTDRGPVRVFDLLLEGQPLLIALDEDTARSLRPVFDQVRTPLQLIEATYQPDERGTAWHLPIHGEVEPFTALQVRPDGHIDWIAPASRPLPVAALRTLLGIPADDANTDTAPSDPGAGVGTWRIRFTTPRGEQTAELALAHDPGGWAGTYNGEAVTGLSVTAEVLTFTCRFREPFPTKVRWTGTIEDDTIQGQAKASFITLPFTATRITARIDQAAPAGRPR